MTNKISGNSSSNWIVQRYSENLEAFHKVANLATDHYIFATEETEQVKLFEVISRVAEHLKEGIDLINSFAIALIDNELEGNFYEMAPSFEPLLRDLETQLESSAVSQKPPPSALGLDDLLSCLSPQLKFHLYEVFQTDDEAKILEQEDNFITELQELAKTNEEVREVMQNAELLPPSAPQSGAIEEDIFFTLKERELEQELHRLKRRIDELEEQNLDLAAALLTNLKKQKVEDDWVEWLENIARQLEPALPLENDQGDKGKHDDD